MKKNNCKLSSYLSTNPRLARTRRIIAFMSVVLILSSCNQSEKNLKKEFYDNGKLKSLATLINGKENGQKISYYENGVISRIENYTEGKLNGSSSFFYENRDIQAILYHRNDTLINNATVFDDSSKISTLYDYVPKYKVCEINFKSDNFSHTKEKYRTTVLAKSQPFITFDPEKDTIFLGETYTASIVLNFPLKGYDCHIF